MVNDLRGTLYSHLQRLSLAFHSRQNGDIMFRITADSFAVQTMLMNGLLPIISAIVLVAGMLLILFTLDPVLTMLSMSVVPVLFLLIALFLPEGFRHFVASMPAPVASGWSGCRVGFAPTGKRRLVTAHTLNRPLCPRRPIVGSTGERSFAQRDLAVHANSSSSAFASFKSAVSKPSVNQP